MIPPDPPEDTTLPYSGLVVLRPKGPITIGEPAAELSRSVEAHLARRPLRMLIVLEEVPYVDTAGLGELVRCVKRVAEAGGRLALVPSPRVRDLMLRLRLDLVFTLCGNEAEGFRALAT